MTHFCTVCGTPLKQGAKYCQKCGARQTAAAGSNSPGRPPGRGPVLVGALGLALLSLGVIATLVLGLTLVGPTPTPDRQNPGSPGATGTDVAVVVASTPTAGAMPTPTPTLVPTLAPTPAPTPVQGPTPTIAPTGFPAIVAGTWEASYEFLSVDGTPSYQPQSERRLWTVTPICTSPDVCGIRVGSADPDTGVDYGRVMFKWDGEAFVREFQPSAAKVCITPAGTLDHAYYALEVIRLFALESDSSGYTIRLAGDDTINASPLEDSAECAPYVVHFHAEAHYVGP